MPRTLSLLTVILCAVVSAASQVIPEEILPAGMLLQCTLDEPNFSSRTEQIGDPVLCHLGAVAAFGHSVFPRGAYLVGCFKDYRDPGRFVGKGWIELAFDRLLLPGAVTVPLSAKVISVPRFKVNREGKIQGRGHPKRDAVGWAIPVLWPIKILTLPARGPRPTFKGEVRITLRLLEDVEVPASGLASRTGSSIPTTHDWKPSERSATSQPSLHSDSAEVPDASVMTTPSRVQPRPQTEGFHYFSESLSAPQLTWLILKDGTSYLVKNYWFQSGRLECINLDGEHKFLPITRLDLDEIIRLNQERNVAIVIRGQER